MKIKMDIWSKSEKGFRKIDYHMVLTEDDINAFARQKYMEEFTIDDDKIYWAEIYEITV